MEDGSPRLNREARLRVLAAQVRDGDAPRTHATTHIVAPLNHDAFGRLLSFRSAAGVSGFDRLLGR
jgi:hypothetical protein